MFKPKIAAQFSASALLLAGLAFPSDAIELSADMKATLAPTYGAVAFGAEVGPTALPFTFAGEAYSQLAPGSPLIWSAWMRTMAVSPSEAGSFGAVVGLNQDQNRYSDGEVNITSLPMGLVLGLSYQRAWGDIWLRVAPHVSLGPEIAGGSSLQPLQVSMRGLVVGPSWLEVGYRVFPGVEVSLRTKVAPLRVSVTF